MLLLLPCLVILIIFAIIMNRYTYILLLCLVQVIVEPSAMFWRQIGGHLKKVETCSMGVTWGVGYDNTAWVYTGGWGGAFLKGI